MSLTHQIHHAPEGTHVMLSGEIDMAVQDDLRTIVYAAIDAAAVTEIDLDQVTYLDCATIGELVRAHLEARRRGRTLVVTRPHGIVERVLGLTNVLPLLAAGPVSAAAAGTPVGCPR